MLKKFEKIENLLNDKLEALIGLFFRIIHILFPKKLFLWIENKKQSFQNFLTRQKQKLVNLGLVLWGKALDFIGKVQEFKNNFTQTKENLIENTKTKILAIVEYLKTTPIKTQLQFFSKIFMPMIEKSASKIKELSSSHGFIAIMALSFVSVGLFSVYYSSQDIYKKEFPNRMPASTQEYDYKPDYKLYPRQTSTFLNMKIPLMVEKVGNVTSVTVDFSVRTSTRFARIYLQDTEHKLKDYFFTSASPIESSFSLKEGGKRQLKSFIKREVNRYLKDNKVEGEVEEVRILFMVGS